MEVSGEAVRRQGSRLRKEQQVREARQGTASGTREVALHPGPHQRPGSLEGAAQGLLEEATEAVEVCVLVVAVCL